MDLSFSLDEQKFRDEVRDFIAGHRAVYVVEQNRDAQCASILRLECPDLAPMIRSVLHYNGLPIDAMSIVEEITRLRQQGVQITRYNMRIAENATLILPLHRELDLVREAAAGTEK